MSENKENRLRYVGIRFTEKEWETLSNQMQNCDYLSISRFIRDKVLDKRIKIDRSVVLTDRVFRNQINSLVKQKRATYYDVSYRKSDVIKHLKAGLRVFVSGRLSINTVVKDGKTYRNNYVFASDLDLWLPPRD